MQGGLVLETNIEEIASASKSSQSLQLVTLGGRVSLVQDKNHARKASYTAANPLSLGGGGPSSRGPTLQTPLGWLTERITGVGAR